jgi:AraC-like DNA-binding protein
MVTATGESSGMKREAKAIKKRRLVALLESMATEEGFTPSKLDAVQFYRANQSSPRAPVAYDPSIVIVAQGRKRGYLGDQVFTYDPCNYLVLSVPLPFECEMEASPDEPLLVVIVQVDPATVSELLMAMDDDSELSGPVPLGVYSTTLTDELTEATLRLLECLKTPPDSRALGRQIVREIIYRVLRGPQGAALRAVAAPHSRFCQIARVLRRIHSEYHNELDVESLAGEANMSVSTFHHNFKAVTAVPPLQYLKSIRLHKAHTLMVQDGLNASTAAGMVGYVSASQFSREFKRFFGNSPIDEAAKQRTILKRADSTPLKASRRKGIGHHIYSPLATPRS